MTASQRHGAVGMQVCVVEDKRSPRVDCRTHGDALTQFEMSFSEGERPVGRAGTAQVQAAPHLHLAGRGRVQIGGVGDQFNPVVARPAPTRKPPSTETLPSSGVLANGSV